MGLNCDVNDELHFNRNVNNFKRKKSDDVAPMDSLEQHILARDFQCQCHAVNYLDSIFCFNLINNIYIYVY